MPTEPALISLSRASDTDFWKSVVTRYREPSTHRALWQIANSVVPYLLLWFLMYWSLAVSYWITLPLAVLAAGFLVRIFIIFHDCGHGSFFESHWANEVVGFIAGMLTFTPYHHWRWEHALHHGTAGDLDHRGAGDVWTLTVQEYLESSRWRRLAYRLARNPTILFVLAPLFYFIVMQRFPSPKAAERERRSVHWMNLAIVALASGVSLAIGLEAYLVIQLTIMAIAGAAGVWLFYVQHQFEGGYWARAGDWDFTAVGLQGSSYYKLPRILQWFSGNIGFHHIHHLSPSIPNYRLQSCHESDPRFQNVPPLTLFSSLKSLAFRFWDERHQRFVGYPYLRDLSRQRVRGS